MWKGAVGAGETVLSGEMTEDADCRPGILKWKVKGNWTGKLADEFREQGRRREDRSSRTKKERVTWVNDG